MSFIFGKTLDFNAGCQKPCGTRSDDFHSLFVRISGDFISLNWVINLPSPRSARVTWRCRKTKLQCLRVLSKGSGNYSNKAVYYGSGKEKKMGAHERKTCIGLGWGGKTHAFQLCQATVREEGVGKAAAAGETDITGTAWRRMEDRGRSTGCDENARGLQTPVSLPVS